MSRKPLLKPELKMQAEFLDASGRLMAWCRGAALPFWAHHGVDSTGRFIECVSTKGIPELEVWRRVRVQFRKVYALDHPHIVGLGNGLPKIAERAMAQAVSDSFLEEDTRQERGCAFLLEADGKVADPTRDLYTQSFYLLALAWR
jgi:mannose/cellobiose epimerase-like protein (N-acyl-D-glucosamine 2-epimerase family)